MQRCSAVLIRLALVLDFARLSSANLDCDCSAVGFRSRRVVGGTALPKTQRFPWMAALLDTDHKLVGGATVLNERFLLTAAHVCTGSLPSGLTALLGSNSLQGSALNANSRLVKIKVLRCVLHPEFSQSSGLNDIAVLELQQRLLLSEGVAPVCLSNSSGTNSVFVSGWGKTSEVDDRTSDDLRMAKLVKASLIHCQSKFGSDIIRVDSVLCAIGNQKDACQGDSGGPLMENDMPNKVWSQIGVVSWGFGCGRVSSPGIYSRVSHFIPWIKQTAATICVIEFEDDDEPPNSVR